MRAAANLRGTRPRLLAPWAIVLVALSALAVLALVAAPALPDWAWRIPAAWTLDLAGSLNRFFTWAARRAAIGPVAVKDITRWLAAAAEIRSTAPKLS